MFDNKPEIAQQASECWVYPPISKGIFLTGPTAGGKTGLGIELAEHLETEIISVDSMAVYQDMNIGTAKPTAADCQRARHHLIDFVPPDNSFSLSEYVKLAHRAVEDLTARNKIPVFVGGTPLYLKGLLRGAFLGPPADEDFRREIADEVDRVGVHKLYERVKQVDPLSAHKIQPTDIRRLTRVLEVERATGTKLSHWQVQFENANQSDNVVACVLQWDRAAIHRRVNMRVDKMIADGLIGEVQQLLKKYPRLSNTARQAVGYKEPMAMLNDEISYEEAIDQIKAHTRQFVRRQEIWFRSTTELQKIPVDEKTMHEVDAVADRSDRLSPVAEQIIAICKEQQLV